MVTMSHGSIAANWSAPASALCAFKRLTVDLSLVSVWWVPADLLGGASGWGHSGGRHRWLLG